MLGPARSTDYAVRLYSPLLSKFFQQIFISKMSLCVEPHNNCVLKFTKVSPEAAAPVKGSIKSAGFDLKSAVDCVVPARGKSLVDTGLVIELPEGCYGRIAPRSGLAVKNFIDVGGSKTKICCLLHVLSYQCFCITNRQFKKKIFI